MDQIIKTRRDNLRRYVDEHGGPTSVAKTLGYTNGSFLSQLIGPKPTRAFSEKVARDMEARLGLAPGWLDVIPVDEQRTAYLVPNMIEDVAQAVQDAQVQASPKQYSTLVALLGRLTDHRGKPDPETLAMLVSLIK